MQAINPSVPQVLCSQSCQHGSSGTGPLRSGTGITVFTCLDPPGELWKQPGPQPSLCIHAPTKSVSATVGLIPAVGTPIVLLPKQCQEKGCYGGPHASLHMPLHSGALLLWWAQAFSSYSPSCGHTTLQLLQAVSLQPTQSSPWACPLKPKFQHSAVAHTSGCISWAGDCSNAAGILSVLLAANQLLAACSSQSL